MVSDQALALQTALRQYPYGLAVPPSRHVIAMTIRRLTYRGTLDADVILGEIVHLGRFNNHTPPTVIANIADSLEYEGFQRYIRDLKKKKENNDWFIEIIPIIILLAIGIAFMPVDWLLGVTHILCALLLIFQMALRYRFSTHFHTLYLAGFLIIICGFSFLVLSIFLFLCQISEEETFVETKCDEILNLITDQIYKEIATEKCKDIKDHVNNGLRQKLILTDTVAQIFDPPRADAKASTH